MLLQTGLCLFKKDRAPAEKKTHTHALTNKRLVFDVTSLNLQAAKRHTSHLFDFCYCKTTLVSVDAASLETLKSLKQRGTRSRMEIPNKEAT